MICTDCMYPEREWTDVTYIFKLFILSFTFILITVPLYGRKFCDGHIILVLKIYLEKSGNFILPFEWQPCYNFSKVQYYVQFYVFVEANVLTNFCLWTEQNKEYSFLQVSSNSTHYFFFLKKEKSMRYLKRKLHGIFNLSS